MKEFKGVWHKVAENPPKPEKEVLIYYKNYLGKAIYRTGYWQDLHRGYRCWWVYDRVDDEINESDIIAWTELPEYEEEQKLFLNSKSYKIKDDRLQVTIFYQDKRKWKLCCKGEGSFDAVSIETDKITLNIKNLEFDSDFAKSRDTTDRWDRGLRFKVLFKGIATSIDGEHPVDMLCNNCEVLYQENDSLVLEALHDENGEKMQLIIEDDDNYKKMKLYQKVQNERSF
nr:MAG TPA: hypothetical protein [Caudoviricetes sp.]